jgi:O-antigen/teichoic acid export membrane protein
MRLLGLVSASILARVLTPEDFGLVGIAISLIASLEAFTTFGTNLVITRERMPTRDLYDTAWTIEFMRGILIALFLIVVARPAAVFFGDPRVEPVIYAISLGALIQAGENVGIVDFMKGLHFDREFRLFLLTKVIAFVVTICAALILRNHWALVLGYLAYRGGRTALSYAMHPFRPRLSLRARHELLGFSCWVWFYSLIGFANGQGQTLLAGKLLDARGLGFFRVGAEVGALPATEIQGPMLRVLFPGLSRIGNEPERFAQLFLDAFRMILLIQVGLSVGLALAAEPFVRVIYGDAWAGMAPLVALVSLATLFQSSACIAEPMLVAAGRLKLFTVIVFTSMAVRLPLLALGLHFWGLTGAGWSLVAASVFEAALTTVLTVRVLGLALGALVAGIWRCALAAAAMAAAVSGLATAWAHPEGVLGQAALLVSLVFVGGTVFAACQAALWLMAGKPDGAEAHLARFLSDRLAIVNFRRLMPRLNRSASTVVSQTPPQK